MTLQIKRLDQPPKLRWRLSDSAHPGVSIVRALPDREWQRLKGASSDALRIALAAVLFDFSMELDTLNQQLDDL